MRCMLSMAHWIMGDTTGSMEADFLGVISKINFRSFTYRALSLGDTVRIGSSRFDVLWPPRIIQDERTLKVIRTAISDFENAVEEDKDLRRIYKHVGERGEIHPYFGTENGGGGRSRRGEEDRERTAPPFPDGQRQFPESVRKANSSLRRAANHLSLAFHQDNWFLFMGDLEEHEIAKVTHHLLNEDRSQFVVTITPHHGTHWHRDLARLSSWWGMSSVGKKLFHHVSPQFNSMFDRHLITHLNGDIEVQLHFASLSHPRIFRSLSMFIGERIRDRTPFPTYIILPLAWFFGLPILAMLAGTLLTLLSDAREREYKGLFIFAIIITAIGIAGLATLKYPLLHRRRFISFWPFWPTGWRCHLYWIAYTLLVLGAFICGFLIVAVRP